MSGRSVHCQWHEGAMGGDLQGGPGRGPHTRGPAPAGMGPASCLSRTQPVPRHVRHGAGGVCGRAHAYSRPFFPFPLGHFSCLGFRALFPLLVLLPPSEAVFLLSFTGLDLFSQNEAFSGSGKCSATSSWKTSPG